MPMFEGMSTIEKEELVVSLATLICADAKVEVTVGTVCMSAECIEGEPRQIGEGVWKQDCSLLDGCVRC